MTRWRTGLGVIATAFSVCAWLPASSAASIVTPAADYRCVPAQASAHDLPGAADVQADLPSPRCPSGQVPYPTSLGTPRHRAPGLGATVNATTAASTPYTFYYAGHHEYDVVGGSLIKATLSIHNPYLAAGDYHSLSEILAGDEDASHRIYNTAEAGWTVGPWVFGSTATRLFVYAGLAGYSNPTCYPGDVVGQGSCGWVQVNSYVKPGDLLPTQNGSSQTFQLIRSNRGWEVYYWYFNVGYFQNAWYGLSGDGFGSATIWDWYGEVAAPYHTGGGVVPIWEMDSLHRARTRPTNRVSLTPTTAMGR